MFVWYQQFNGLVPLFLIRPIAVLADRTASDRYISPVRSKETALLIDSHAVLPFPRDLRLRPRSDFGSCAGVVQCSRLPLELDRRSGPASREHSQPHRGGRGWRERAVEGGEALTRRKTDPMLNAATRTQGLHLAHDIGQWPAKQALQRAVAWAAYADDLESAVSLAFDVRRLARLDTSARVMCPIPGAS